jgi:hypothetical protein
MLPILRRCTLCALAAALVASNACDRRPAADQAEDANRLPGAAEAQYLAPPRPVAAMVDGQSGALRVLGRAPPKAQVALTSPDGRRETVQADPRGSWTVRLLATEPRMFAISARLADRTGPELHAEGALLITPGPRPAAVMVRAGYAAMPLYGGSDEGVSTVDYDPSGMIAVAGFAAPHAQLSLTVDGAAAAVGQADEHGLYALTSANRRLSMGPHLIAVRSPEGEVQRTILLEPPIALAAPYIAARSAEGWRVEWALNGGGVQTTLILDR